MSLNTKTVASALAALAEPVRAVSTYLSGNKTVRATVKTTRQGQQRPDIHVIELEKVVVVSMIMKNELGLDFYIAVPETPHIDVAIAATKYVSRFLIRNLGCPVHLSERFNEDEIADFLEKHVGKRIEITSRMKTTISGKTYTAHAVKLLDESPFSWTSPPPPSTLTPKLSISPSAAPTQRLKYNADGTPIECLVCGRQYCDHPRG